MTKQIRSCMALVLLLNWPMLFFAQKSTTSGYYLVNTFSFYQNNAPALSHTNFFDQMAKAMQLADGSQMVLEQTIKGQNGYTHYRYQQQHRGLPVFGCRYTLHEKNRQVQLGTGRIAPQIALEHVPLISTDVAAGLAKKAMKSEGYSPSEARTTLCYIDPEFPGVSGTVRLAHQVEVSSAAPLGKERYFIDAKNGEVLAHFPLILHEGVPSKAKTRYYGLRDIVTDSLGPQYFELRDPGRDISVYSAQTDIFSNTSSLWDLANANKDEVALDAHYCTQAYHDLLLSEYNWLGLDGNGSAMKARIHRNNFGSVNAFWDGEFTNYGDGTCIYGPLTTLEIVGHEFTHGLIDASSKLVYSGEPGAINESLADIFGKRLEYAADSDHFDWDLGHSFVISPTALPFRVMDDPNVMSMPALYRGGYWEDFADVHTNSSIGNLWFTMIVDGKQGTNEKGIAYDVPKLGMEKAGQIVFETNKSYLTESSTYQDFYLYSTAVAETLYGVGSVEALAVKEAWKAVGLPTPPVSGLDLYLGKSTVYFEKHCIKNQYFPVKVMIENRGAEPYFPLISGTANLKFTSDGLSTVTVPLLDTIWPGEAYEVLVDNWLFVNENDFFRQVTADLEFVDADQSNHQRIWGLTFPDVNASDIGVFGIAIEDRACFGKINASLYWINNYCDPIPAGSILHYSIKNEFGDISYTDTDTLQHPIPGNGAGIKTMAFDFQGASMEIQIDWDGDNLAANNTISQPVYEPELITTDYLHTFSNDPQNDPKLLLTASAANYTMTYQGSKFFAVTGGDAEGVVSPCPDPVSTFNILSSASGINTCVDFSAHAAPFVGFKLAQFRSNFATQNNDDFSSMMQVSWAGVSGTGSEIILGQPEGQVQPYLFALPPYFKGKVAFKFHTMTGAWDIAQGNLNTDDYQLMDDLRFLTQPSEVEDLPLPLVQVVPNPAADRVVVQTNQIIEQVWLRQLNGQQVRHFTANTTQQRIDLQGLPNGFYLLDIQLGNGQRVVEKLVKM